MKKRNVLEGVGASLILLMPYYCKFLLPSNPEIFRLRLPATNLIGGILVDLLVYSILSIGFLVAVQYSPPVLKRIMEALFAALMLWLIVDFVFLAMNHLQNRIKHWDRISEISAFLIPLLSCVLAYFLPRFTQPIVRVVRLVIAGCAFSALWIVPQLLHLALVRQPVQSNVFARPPVTGSEKSQQRIIWILFDELSYNQTFDHRAAGIELPNLDRLRAGSVSFSNLKPVGFYTARIIPSLFSGQRINRVRSTIHGELWYWDDSQRRWLAYDPNATLFGLAQRKGWNTGIDGWAIPYCRILAPVVNACSWATDPTQVEEFGASVDKSVLANAAVMPTRFGSLFHGTKVVAEERIQAYRDIMSHTQTLIADDQLRFLFLHIPVPHPPGIYDRQRHILRPSGNYLDNLVLADDTLGVLMREIAATPSAGQTTVIVSSDHSWRIPLWLPAQSWTSEEELASGAKFDERPVLLIHFPDQKAGSDIHAESSEMLEHGIIAGMLLGQIHNPNDLDVFISQQGR